MGAPKRQVLICSPPYPTPPHREASGLTCGRGGCLRLPLPHTKAQTLQALGIASSQKKNVAAAPASSPALKATRKRNALRPLGMAPIALSGPPAPAPSPPPSRGGPMAKPHVPPAGGGGGGPAAPTTQHDPHVTLTRPTLRRPCATHRPPSGPPSEGQGPHARPVLPVPQSNALLRDHRWFGVSFGGQRWARQSKPTHALSPWGTAAHCWAARADGACGRRTPIQKSPGVPRAPGPSGAQHFWGRRAPTPSDPRTPRLWVSVRRPVVASAEGVGSASSARPRGPRASLSVRGPGCGPLWRWRGPRGSSCVGLRPGPRRVPRSSWRKKCCLPGHGMRAFCIGWGAGFSLPGGGGGG